MTTDHAGQVMLENLAEEDTLRAQILAELIRKVNLSDRGNILYACGVLLSNAGQYYTGNVLKNAGTRYGLNVETHHEKERPIFQK